MLFARFWIWSNGFPRPLCRRRPDGRHSAALPSGVVPPPSERSARDRDFARPFLLWLHEISMATIAKLKSLASRKAANPPLAGVPPAAAADEDDDLPIPSDITRCFWAAFSFSNARRLLCSSRDCTPTVLAFVLSLVLQPAMRLLERVRLPRGMPPFSSSWCCSARLRVGDGALGTGNQLGTEAAH
jgi:hypothetical protein